MKGLICTLFILFYSTNSHAGINLTIGGGLSTYTTKELTQNNGTAQGNSTHFKLGMLNKKFEIGLYSGTQNYSLDLEHDSVDNTLEVQIQTIGSYIAYYANMLYFELGYGKADIKEKLDSSLSDTSKAILVDLYNLNLDGSTSANEARFLMGIRALNLGNIVLTGFAQKTIMLNTSHNSTLFGVELKVSF